jgi:hypothetical protein
MQALIGENMQHLDIAMVDERYVKFCKKKYKSLTDAVDEAKDAAYAEPDVDLESHYKSLDNFFKRSSSEWQLTPLERPEHDFVSDLMNRYMEDIEVR